MDGGAIDGATETPIIRGQFDSDEASDAAKQVYASMTPLGRIGPTGGVRRRRYQAAALARRSAVVSKVSPDPARIADLPV